MENKSRHKCENLCRLDLANTFGGEDMVGSDAVDASWEGACFSSEEGSDVGGGRGAAALVFSTAEAGD